MFQIGSCVRIPDGRIGRVRKKEGSLYIVRVRRRKGLTHQFLSFRATELQAVECPKGWMSPQGYMRYLKATFAKMKARLKSKKGS